MIYVYIHISSAVLQTLSAMKETWVWSLGQEDPLEEEMATHSSILAWKIPWTEEPGRLHTVHRVWRIGQEWMTEHAHIYPRVSISHIWLFETPWTVACQASPSMGFSRQEYWSGLPFPSPGDPPDQGIGPTSLALQADSLPRATYTTESQTYQIQHL